MEGPVGRRRPVGSTASAEEAGGVEGTVRRGGSNEEESEEASRVDGERGSRRPAASLVLAAVGREQRGGEGDGGSNGEEEASGVYGECGGGQRSRGSSQKGREQWGSGEESEEAGEVDNEHGSRWPVTSLVLAVEQTEGMRKMERRRLRLTWKGGPPAAREGEQGMMDDDPPENPSLLFHRIPTTGTTIGINKRHRIPLSEEE